MRPPWYPLGQTQVVIFDEQENPVTHPVPIGPQPPPGPAAFGAEAQRTKVNGPLLPVPFNFGWLYMNLQQTNVTAGANPPLNPQASQAWVETVMDAEGRFSVGFNAIQLDNASNANTIILPVGP